MGIDRFIQKVCVQTAVYWGNPVNDGYGGFTFDEAVEIPCRWDDKVQILKDNAGIEKISRAEVLLTQDVDELGYLFLGSLDDLPSDHDNPAEIEEAYMINVFTKVPMIKSTTIFVRKAYLTESPGGKFNQ